MTSSSATKSLYTFASKPVHSWHRIGDIIVSFTRSGTLADDTWFEYVDSLESEGVRVALGFASNESAGLSAMQRKRVSEALKAKGIITISVTNSRLIRGMATAVSWLGIKVKAFPWSDCAEAIVAAEASPEEASQIQVLADQFRDQTSCI